ncbi:hypothetical protein WDW86_02920, partial [Bdellovibrionota bacterium FG-2]
DKEDCNAAARADDEVDRHRFKNSFSHEMLITWMGCTYQKPMVSHPQLFQTYNGWVWEPINADLQEGTQYLYSHLLLDKDATREAVLRFETGNFDGNAEGRKIELFGREF